MFILQDPQEVRDSVAINANVQALYFRLASSRVWSVPPSDLSHEDVEMESQIGFRPTEVSRSDNELRLQIEFNFGIHKSEPEPKDLLSFECRFEAVYELAEDFEPSDEQISAFHSANAVFNCWPYFREFVQNTAVRMHMPPPQIPFLRLGPKSMGNSENPAVERPTPQVSSNAQLSEKVQP
jgi:hypothetical protein